MARAIGVGWRREGKLKLIRTINPEFKDLAQSWGSKTITVHEKMYPWPSSPYRSRSCSRASTVEKLRAAWVK